MERRKGSVACITDKRCCGCAACANACPKNCIVMLENVDGFYIPRINQDICIKCGVCLSVCPSKAPRETIKKYAKPAGKTVFVSGYHNDKLIRLQSSSGGAFSALAQTVIEQRGAVFGAVERGQADVRHQKACTMEELVALRRSKYLPSRIDMTFREVRACLNTGQKVLFAGTSCQVAGLLGYLQGDHPLLITCDLVCEGVPSLRLYRRFLEEEEHRYKKAIYSYHRDKAEGWYPVLFSAFFEDGSKIVFDKENDLYHKSRESWSLNKMESCYRCPYNGIPNVADFTLGDNWVDIQKQSQEDCQLGISLFSINSSKGQEFFVKAKERMTVQVWEKLDRTYYTLNYAFCAQRPKQPLRNEFFAACREADSIKEILKEYKPRIEAGEKTYQKKYRALMRRCAIIAFLRAYAARLTSRMIRRL